MLEKIKCKRCGREIVTLAEPIHSSSNTMRKYRGICSRCMTDKEAFEMMMDMRDDAKQRLVK